VFERDPRSALALVRRLTGRLVKNLERLEAEGPVAAV